jgi:hypothetical protein
LRSLPAVIGFYLCLLLLLHAPFLFFHQSLFIADLTYNDEPISRFMREYLWRTGRMADWNPYALSGAPVVALQWPLFYLPGAIFLVAPFPIAASLFLLFHQFLAGIGGLLWRIFEVDDADQTSKISGAVVFGLLFMLCGYMVGSSANLSLAATVAWIPWVLFLIDRISQRPGSWVYPLLAAVLGLQLCAGRPELIVLSWILYSTYFVLVYRSTTSGRQDACAPRLKMAVTVCGVMLTAVMMAAGNIFPLIQLLNFEPHVGSLNQLGLTFWRAGWFDLLGIVLSQPFGFLSMANYQLYPTQPGDMPYITSLYLGLPALVLSILGFTKRTWIYRWFWLAVLFAGLVIATGWFRYLIGPVSWIFPDLQFFRFPIKASIFILLPLCVAAAEGWTAFFGGTISKLKIRLAIIGSLLWAVIGGVAACAIYRSCSRLPLEIIFSGSIAAALLSLFLLPRRHMIVRTTAVIWLSALSLLMLVNACLQLWNTVDDDFFDQPSEVADWLVRANGHDRSSFRAASLLQEQLSIPSSFDGVSAWLLDGYFMQYTRKVLKPNSNLDFGIQLANGASIVPTWGSYFLQTGLLPRSSLTAAEHPAGKSDLPLQRWCQADGVKYLLSSAVLNQQFFRLSRTFEGLNLRVYEVPEICPRWYLQDRFLKMPDIYSALTFMNRADKTHFDPKNIVLITDPEKKTSDPIPPNGDAGLDLMPMEYPGEIDFVQDITNSQIIRTRAKVACFLVVSDSYYPGWVCRDNGSNSKIYIANGLYRAVYLTPGVHVVEFVYKPVVNFAGNLVSRVACIVLVIWLYISVAMCLIQWWDKRYKLQP